MCRCYQTRGARNARWPAQVAAQRSPPSHTARGACPRTFILQSTLVYSPPSVLVLCSFWFCALISLYALYEICASENLLQFGAHLCHMISLFIIRYPCLCASCLKCLPKCIFSKTHAFVSKCGATMRHVDLLPCLPTHSHFLPTLIQSTEYTCL